MASLSTAIPANYFEIMLATNPSAASFEIGGVSYSRSVLLAQFNALADASENTVSMVGLKAIKNSPVTSISKRAFVK